MTVSIPTDGGGSSSFTHRVCLNTDVVLEAPINITPFNVYGPLTTVSESNRIGSGVSVSTGLISRPTVKCERLGINSARTLFTSVFVDLNPFGHSRLS